MPAFIQDEQTHSENKSLVPFSDCPFGYMSIVKSE